MRPSNLTSAIPVAPTSLRPASLADQGPMTRSRSKEAGKEPTLTSPLEEAALKGKKRKQRESERLQFMKMLMPDSSASGSKQKPDRNISILGTGGTIAGEGKDKTQTSSYKAGEIPIEKLLDSFLPQLDLPSHVKITAKDLFKIDSKDVNDKHWLNLAKNVAAELEKDDVHGVVITHGTDTLTSSAFFLHLTVRSNKPIVLVGAMRPATAISADGPMNVNAAIRVAKSRKSAGMGVMVVVNDTIYSARDVAKKHTTNVGAFQHENWGPLGTFADNKVSFGMMPARKHTTASEFNLDEIHTLPAVDIIASQAGVDPQRLVQRIKDAVRNNARGIVYAGTGDGTMHKEVEEELRKVVTQGVLVIRSSKTGSGEVVHNAAVKDKEAGFVSSGSLSPDKSAILAQLALTQIKDDQKIQPDNIQKIQKMFKEY